MAETVQGETLVRGELYQTVNTWTGVTYTGARVASPEQPWPLFQR